jgi:hypothetical protein
MRLVMNDVISVEQENLRWIANCVRDTATLIGDQAKGKVCSVEAKKTFAVSLQIKFELEGGGEK